MNCALPAYEFVGMKIKKKLLFRAETQSRQASNAIHSAISSSDGGYQPVQNLPFKFMHFAVRRRFAQSWSEIKQ